MMFMFVAVGLLVLLPGAALVGYGLGRREHALGREIDVSTDLPNALLALAALLIGFTFAMAQSRYDERKRIVVGEAASIRTLYERTRLLDDARGAPLRALLRRYVDARVEFTEGGSNEAQTEVQLRQSAALEEQIWSDVAAAARTDPHSVMMSQVVQAASQMFAAADEHEAALENPLPPSAFLILALVSAVALGGVGLICGLKQRRSWLGMVVMPVLLALVILLVFDLAHPRLGVIRVHAPILNRLKQSLGNASTAL